MSNILYVNDEENEGKVDIDALFEKKQQSDLKQVSIFNKILNRIHKRIQHNGRIKSKEKFIFFTVPEYLFGEPLYNQGDCIGYLVVKLQDNGFHVKYIHPNTLFISWQNWIPSYVRTEIKKKTGKIINEKGDIIGDKNQELEEEEINDDPNNGIFNQGRGNTNQKPNKEYTPIDQYKPSGIYNKEIFDKLQKRL
jgi:hypothetical protein